MTMSLLRWLRRDVAFERGKKSKQEKGNINLRLLLFFFLTDMTAPAPYWEACLVAIKIGGILCGSNRPKGADLTPTQSRSLPEALLVGGWAFVLMANLTVHWTYVISGRSCVS